MNPLQTDPIDPGTRLLRERIRSVFRHLPQALSGNEERLHQMRIAARRLRVALPLLARQPDGKKVRRAVKGLRQLTRTPGASRDLDVMVSLAEKHWRQADALTAEGRVLRRRLLAARARSRRSMAEALLDLEIAQLRRDLRAVLARGGDVLFSALVRLRETRDRDGERALDMLATLGRRFDADTLHEVRISLRRLRYAAEVQDLLKGVRSDATRLFKDLQERLGHLRDAYVLSEWFAVQAARAERTGQGPVAREAKRLAGLFRATSVRHHRELVDARPDDLVRHALEEMGYGRTAA
ncbi:MAG: CHAD domain-containing protein [Vicinamibacteria bacterium]